MLTKITLDNFKSFKNKTTVDLAKTNYTILPQNVADNGILKGCIFVGANASGKSTIILGVKLLLDFLFSERNLNSGIFLCMFGNGPCYSLSYEFLVEKKKINYFFEVDVVKKIISEKLWIDDALMLERMGLSAKSYIAEPAGVNYDEADVSKDTLFLRTLYFNTKFTSNPTLSAWMDYLKNLYISTCLTRTLSLMAKQKYRLHVILTRVVANQSIVSLTNTTLNRTSNMITAARAVMYVLLSKEITLKKESFSSVRASKYRFLL